MHNFYDYDAESKETSQSNPKQSVPTETISETPTREIPPAPEPIRKALSVNEPERETSFTPEPEAQKPQTPRASFPSKASAPKIYSILRFLPAVFLFLCGVLALAFLAAPAVKINFLGFINSVNAYKCLSEPDMQFLRASIISIIVFAAISIPLSVTMFYAALKSDGIKPNRFSYVAFPLFLAVAFSASAIVALIKDFDGGTGLVTAGASPILLIVFPLVFALLSLLSSLARLWLKYTVPAFSEEISAERKRYAEQLLSLAPPVPPEPVQKATKRYSVKPKAAKEADRLILSKAILLSSLLLLTAIILIVTLLPYKQYSGYTLKTPIAILIFCMLYYIVAIVAFILLMRRFKRPAIGIKKERSLKAYIIAFAVIVSAAVVALICSFAIKGGIIGYYHYFYNSYSWYEYLNPSTDTGVGVSPSASTFSGSLFTVIAIAITVGIIIIAAISLITAYAYRGAVNKAAPSELNKDYLEYCEKENAYREYQIQKAAYKYERLRYAFGKSYEKKPPHGLLVFWTNKLWISIATVFLAVLIAIPCFVFPTITNTFRASVAGYYELGATKGEVENYLGKGIESNGGYLWEFYSDNYTDILNKIETNEDAVARTEDLTELEKLTAEHTRLTKQLSQINYKYIAVQFEKIDTKISDYKTKYDIYVYHVLLDTVRCKSADYVVKKVRSVRLIRDSVSAEEFSLPEFRLSARIYYEDGSYQATFLPASAFTLVEPNKSGKYTLAWSDSWGEYKATLNIT